MTEQELRVEPGRLRARGLEAVGPVAQDLADGHTAAVSSARRRSSACSASVNSSSPPGSTFSRFRVTLTRWSVTRLSG